MMDRRTVLRLALALGIWPQQLYLLLADTHPDNWQAFFASVRSKDGDV